MKHSLVSSVRGRLAKSTFLLDWSASSSKLIGHEGDILVVPPQRTLLSLLSGLKDK